MKVDDILHIHSSRTNPPRFIFALSLQYTNRGESLAHDFLELSPKLFDVEDDELSPQQIAKKFVYDLSYTLALSDSEMYAETMKPSSFMQAVLAGPTLFSYVGKFGSY